MTKPTSDFYADSSGALNLDHKASSGSLTPTGARRNSGGIDAYLRESEETHKRVSGEMFDKRVSELHKQGMTIRQATERAQFERDNPDAPKEIRDHEAKKRQFIERLMRPPVTPQGGSSQSGRKRSAKKGTWICESCHLEYCEHRPPKVGGRPSSGGRSSRLVGKVSDEVVVALRESPVSAGEIVEAVVRAAMAQSGSISSIRGLLDGLC